MSATILPLKRRTEITLVAHAASDIGQAVRLAAIRVNLELQREQLLELIEGLRTSSAAGMNGDLGTANESLSSAACFTLVQVELMLRNARALSAVV